MTNVIRDILLICRVLAIIIIVSGFSVGEKAFGQEHVLPEVVITATRTPVNPEDFPGRVEIISKVQLESVPANNIDDLLKDATGIEVGRTNGIFSKNASVTMRGLNGSYRSLILVDGIPMNKSDGGSVNWNRLSAGNVEQIEVVEGPGSALYGGNAMSGTINIITREPAHRFETNASLTAGSFGTLGASLFAGGKAKTNGFSWSVNSFARRGNGYNTAPDSIRDSTDVPLYLKEFSLGCRVDYQFESGGKLSLDLNYYDDERGDGFKAFEGGYNKFTTRNVHLDYKAIILGWMTTIAGFYQAEDFQNLKESLKYDKNPPYAYAGYSLYESAALRVDQGIWMSFTRSLHPNHNVTFGSDLKLGGVTGADTYFTSTDIIHNEGKMSILAIFAQDEISLYKNRLRAILGLRYDAAKFSDASFTIEEQTAISDFMTGLTGPYENSKWQALSPKLSVMYFLRQDQRLYFAYGRGFRPPILDDMCRNRNISKGFKLANPELTPEYMDNLEIGGSFKLMKRISLKPTVYYSVGRDFNYFVNTGDSLMAGTKLKPILKRQNVAGVNIVGFQVYLTAALPQHLFFTLNYAHNTGTITSFSVTAPGTPDLSGNSLVETSPNVVYSSLRWETRWVNLRLGFQFVDASWYDDENTRKNPSYQTLDFKAWRHIGKAWAVSVGVQNLMNNAYLDNQGTLGLPRYFSLELNYHIQYQ